MKVKQGDSSISPAAYAAACEALEGSRRPKAIHLSPYEDLIKRHNINTNSFEFVFEIPSGTSVHSSLQLTITYFCRP